MSDLSQQLAEQVRQAFESGQSLRPRGSGSYGLSPPSGVEPLELGAHRGVVSYDPTEMVVTVRGGTPLVEIESLLAAEGQQLGVESPRLSAEASIGGAVAMGLSGSARPFNGALRDFVLGVRMVNGCGEDLSFGGQVMKNVAGYDVSRLLVGSRGRFGALLEVSLRVLPQAEEQLYLELEQPDLASAVAFCNGLQARAEPLTGAGFCEGRLYLRFAGRRPTLARLRAELGGEGGSQDWWNALRQWQMPWGRPAWRNYRSRLDTQPQLQGRWLADWNGGLIWSEQRDAAADACLEVAADRQPQAPLRQAPLRQDPLRQDPLQQQLAAAFDPAGIFSKPEVTGAD